MITIGSKKQYKYMITRPYYLVLFLGPLNLKNLAKIIFGIHFLMLSL